MGTVHSTQTHTCPRHRPPTPARRSVSVTERRCSRRTCARGPRLKKLTKANLDTATKAFQKYFDEERAPDLRSNGTSAAEVRAMRADFKPHYVFFPGQSDPNDLVSSYPLVFSFKNPTGSDHGCYVGLNPTNGDTEAYTFN